MKAIETRYKGYRFRSRLEVRWAVFFDALGVEWEYEKEGYELPEGYYLPDFFITRWKMWIEIKPQNDDNPLAFQKCLSLALETNQNVLLIEGNPWAGEHEVNLFIPSGGFEVGEWCEMEIPLWGWGVCIGLRHPKGGFLSAKYPLDTFDDPVLQRAFEAARSARFEHGETPKF